MEEINSLKTQGNQLFQQKNFEQAIQVYTQATNAIEKIVGAFNLNEEEQVQLLTLRLAVILNRALAYIELKNIDQIGLAEVDCTHALELQPGSIKALYRRALARELMGKIRVGQFSNTSI
jgi:tetratricopeptide (TPR) repeat protein